MLFSTIPSFVVKRYFTRFLLAEKNSTVRLKATKQIIADPPHVKFRVSLTYYF